MTLSRESDSPQLRRYDASVRHRGEAYMYAFTEWTVGDVVAKLAKLIDTEPTSATAGGSPLTIEIRRLG